MDLDTRARRAAETLRRSVDDLRPEPLPVPSAPRRRRLAAVAAAAAAVALATSGSLVAANRDGDDGVEVVAGPASSPSSVPRLLPTELPEGLRPAGAADLPTDDAAQYPASVYLYGRPGADDPFADGDFGVVVTQDSENGDGLGLVDEEEPAVPVRGRQGRRTEADDPGRQRGFAWHEDDRTQVQVTTRSLSDDELLAVAEGLEFSPEGVLVGVRNRPRGLAAVVEEHDAVPGGLGSVPFLTNAEGHGVGYQDADDDTGMGLGRFLSVATQAGGREHLDALRWLFPEPARSVEAGGHDAFLFAFEDLEIERPSPYSTVAWVDGGAVVMVAASGVPEDELLAVAGSLREATDQEWAALLAAAEDAELSEGSAVLARGEADGARWRLILEDQGAGEPALCFELQRGEGASAECSGTAIASVPPDVSAETSGGAESPGTTAVAPEAAGPLPGLPSVTSGSPHFVYGRVGKEVRSVSVHWSDDDGTGARIVGTDAGQATNFYVLETPVPDGLASVTVVALDATGGRELARATVPVPSDLPAPPVTEAPPGPPPTGGIQPASPAPPTAAEGAPPGALGEAPPATAGAGAGPVTTATAVRLPPATATAVVRRADEAGAEARSDEAGGPAGPLTPCPPVTTAPGTEQAIFDC